MNVIGSRVIYHHAHSTQSLSITVRDIEGSVTFSCTNKIAIGLLSASDKQDKKVPSSSKCFINQAHHSNVYKKIYDDRADQQISKQPQSKTNNQEVIYTKEDLMSLFSDCFTGLGKF